MVWNRVVNSDGLWLALSERDCPAGSRRSAVASNLYVRECRAEPEPMLLKVACRSSVNCPENPGAMPAVALAESRGCAPASICARLTRL